MYSAYKLNKQGDNIQPSPTPLPIWNQSVVLFPVLTVASWPAYRFLRRQVRWSDIPTSNNFSQFVAIHSQSFHIVNEAKVNIFLEFSCFFCDPTNAGNLISGSFAFSKSSLYIWKSLAIVWNIILLTMLHITSQYLFYNWNYVPFGHSHPFQPKNIVFQIFFKVLFCCFLVISIRIVHC